MSQQVNTAPPVACLPWVSHISSNQRLQDTIFYRDKMTCHGPQKAKLNLQLYRMLNNINPFYLPARYHSMDCLALSKKALKKGNYWAQASNFLLDNQFHGVLFWSAIPHCCTSESQYCPQSNLENLPYLSNTKKCELFKDGVEMCQSASEFLLEPGVLIQLPFHPVLLQQWAVAALAAYYDFLTKMVILYRWPLPHNLTSSVDKLMSIAKVVPGHLLQLFFGFHFNQSVISDHIKFQTVSSAVLKIVCALVPVLKFITSENANSAINALKRMAWTLNFKCLDAIYFVPHIYKAWDNYNDRFNDNFWQAGKYDEIFGSVEDEDEFNPDPGDPFAYVWKEKSIQGFKQLLHEVTPHWLEKMFLKYGRNISNEEILKMVEHEILTEGAIHGEITRGDLLQAISMFKDFFLGCYFHLRELKNLIIGGLNKNDRGVMFDMLYLKTNYKITDIKYVMIFKLFDVCHMWKCKLKLGALNANGPRMTIRDVNKTVMKAFDEKTKWSDITKKVLSGCLPEVNNECPDLNNNSAPEIVKILESRIKRMVIKIVEDQLEWRENQAKLHPDWQFIQYILPCFVASFLDLTENPDVDLEGKQNYLKFVHEFIKDFEEKPYKAMNYHGAFPGGYSPYQMGFEGTQQIILWQDELIQRGLYNCINISKNCSYEAVKMVNQMYRDHFSNFFEFLSKTSISPQDPRKEALEPLNCHYMTQVCYMNKRVLKALQIVVPESLPNLKMLDIYMSMNVFMCDFFARGIKSADYTNKDLMENPIYRLMLWEVRPKVMELLRVRRNRFNGFTFQTTDEEENVVNECKHLSVEQIFSILVYHCWKPVSGKGTIELKGDLRVPTDIVEEAFFACRSNDAVKLKLILSQLLNDSEGDNPSEVTFEYAKALGPTIYKGILERVHDGRVVMKPCEVTLIPLRHCGWCGLVDPNVLRLCCECVDDPDYPNRTWFCGDLCENKALDLEHKEEHARSLLMRLGENPRCEFDELEAAAQKKKSSKKKRARYRR